MDAGNALFKHPYVVQSKREHLEAVAQAIIESYNVMGLQVMNVGASDLGAGEEFILRMEEIAEFPMISANITGVDSTKNLFDPYVILKTHDQTLGFVGVSTGDKRLKEFTFSDPIEAAKQAVEKISSKVDLVFLMANVDDKMELLLAEEVDGIDFIIRSNTRSVQKNPKQHNGTVVIRIGSQGKYAGVLDIRKVDAVSEMKNVSLQYKRIKFSQDRLKAMSKGLDEGMSLEDHYADDENRLKLIAKLRNDLETNQDLIKKLKNSYHLEVISLNDKIEDTPEVAEIVKEYMPKKKEHTEKH